MKKEKIKTETSAEILLSSINRKMSVILALLITNEEEKNFEAEIQKVNKLKEWGLEVSEIAEILGKNNKQISDQLYNLKRKKK